MPCAWIGRQLHKKRMVDHDPLTSGPEGVETQARGSRTHVPALPLVAELTNERSLEGRDEPAPAEVGTTRFLT